MIILAHFENQLVKFRIDDDDWLTSGPLSTPMYHLSHQQPNMIHLETNVIFVFLVSISRSLKENLTSGPQHLLSKVEKIIKDVFCCVGVVPFF